MAKAAVDNADRNDAPEERISLAVIPQGPGSPDIHVEIRRSLTVKKRRSQRRFAAFMFTVMFLLVFPIVRDVFVFLRMTEERRALLESNQELLSAQQELEEERESLYSPEMVERLAREELDMVMPGESKVYPALPTTDIPQRQGIRSGEVFH